MRLSTLQTSVTSLIFEIDHSINPPILDYTNPNIQNVLDALDFSLELTFLEYLKINDFKHYFQIFQEKFRNLISLKYINSLNYLQTNKEKARVWVYIQVFCEKTLDKLMIEFRLERNMDKDKIYKLVYQIQRIFLAEKVNVNSEIFNEYQNFKERLKKNEDPLRVKLKKEWEALKKNIINEKIEKLRKNNEGSYSAQTTQNETNIIIDLSSPAAIKNLKEIEESSLKEKLFQKSRFKTNSEKSKIKVENTLKINFKLFFFLHYSILFKCAGVENLFNLSFLPLFV